MPRKETFKGLVNKWADDNNMSGTDIIKTMGVNPSTYYRWLKRPGSMSLSSFMALCRVLHLTDDEIVRLEKCV